MVLDTVLWTIVCLHMLYNKQDIYISFVRATTVDSKASQIHQHHKRTDGKLTFRCFNISIEPEFVNRVGQKQAEVWRKSKLGTNSVSYKSQKSVSKHGGGGTRVDHKSR